jgi:hypothetical protein
MDKASRTAVVRRTSRCPVGVTVERTETPLEHGCPMCGARPGLPCVMVYYERDSRCSERRIEFEVDWFHAWRRRLADPEWAEKAAEVARGRAA